MEPGRDGLHRPQPAPAPAVAPRATYLAAAEPEAVAPGADDPPDPRVKERKQVIAIGGTAAKIVNAVGEIPDFVEAFHDALPAKYKSKRVGTINQARALYDHWDKVDMQQAIINLILNQAEDYALMRPSLPYA